MRVISRSFVVVILIGGATTSEWSTDEVSGLINPLGRDEPDRIVESSGNTESESYVVPTYTSISFWNQTVVYEYRLPKPPIKLFNKTPIVNIVGIPIFNSTKPTALCGYPPYNARLSCQKQNQLSDVLYQCEHEGGAIVFGVVVGLLGITILCVNCIFPVIVWRSTELRTQYNYIKVSLSFADVLPGILLLADVLPGIIRLRRLTHEQAFDYLNQDTNSLTAVIIGSLLTTSLQASLLHLVFLSIERFTAIQWPLRHRMRKNSTISGILAGIWIVSILCSFVPHAFPEYFEYQYQPALLIHMMTLKYSNVTAGDLGFDGTIYAIFAMILPFLTMVVFCILTGIVAYRKLASRDRVLGSGSGEGCISKGGSEHTSTKSTDATTTESKLQLKPEVSAFITIVIMIIAFSVTLLPFVAVVILFIAGVLDCDSYTVPYVVSFYAGISNCLMNPIIYTIRDRKFCEAARKVLRPTIKFARKPGTHVHSRSGATDRAPSV